MFLHNKKYIAEKMILTFNLINISIFIKIGSEMYLVERKKLKSWSLIVSVFICEM